MSDTITQTREYQRIDKNTGKVIKYYKTWTNKGAKRGPKASPEKEIKSNITKLICNVDKEISLEQLLTIQYILSNLVEEYKQFNNTSS